MNAASEIRRYEAVDMSEAIRMVKYDLGPDAVILSSRKVRKGSGSFGMFGRQVYEVTAAPPRSAAPSRAAMPPRERMGAAAPGGLGRDGGSASLIASLRGELEEIKKTLAALSARKDNVASGDFSDDMMEMKSMVAHLLDAARPETERSMGRGLIALSRILRDRGLAPEYVHALTNEIGARGGEGGDPDIKTLLYVAARALGRSLLAGGWIEPETGRGAKVVALAGPTGVGKTTTIAKLAALLTRRGAKVGLVTIDTYRIAAVEQLRIYAGILKIPLEVALSPGDFARAVDAFGGMDAVLVDTAGRSQRDAESIEELSRFFQKAQDVDVRLALSAASSERQMNEAARAFSKLSVGGLILTKLDEAPSLGGAVSLQLRTGLPVSYITAGQRVPEDIEEASVKRLVNMFFRTNGKS